MTASNAIGQTRAGMYAQLSSLELDLQGVLTQHVSPYMSMPTLLGPQEAKCIRRRNDQPDSSDDDEPLTSFLDFGDYVQLLNQHRAMLPADLQLALRGSNDALNRAAPIRTRVMHSSRPLMPSDPDDLAAIVSTVVATGLPVPQLLASLQDLVNETWRPKTEPAWDADTRVLHNLPSPDFDETGLIGRTQLVRQVTRLLLAGREPVITLVGPGGVGKTALALQVLSNITIIDQPPFEAILWASLKTESLTGEGIRQLRGASVEAFDIPDLLSQSIDSTGRTSLQELSDAISGSRTLVVIDNLETANSDEILELYDSLPPETRFLFTSRMGLGQLERRVEVGPLDAGDSTHLLRLFARRRGLDSVAKLSEPRLQQIANQLMNVPLAIKWFVMAVARGARIEDVLHDQSDLLRFCLDSVFESLSEASREVAFGLLALPSTASFTQLGVVLDLPADDLRHALLELQQCAVVRIDRAFEDERFELSETATDYLSRVAPPDESTLGRYREEARRLRHSEERRRTDEQRRSLGSNAVRIRNAGDAGAADLLRQALSASKRQDSAQASNLLTHAEELAPAFFEVHRVAALVASFNGDYARATSGYARALELATDEAHRGFVLHYAGEHSVRNLSDIDEGTDRLEESHRILSQPESAMSLARAYTFQGRFDEARDLLTGAIPETAGRTRLIAETSLLDVHYRASEDHRIRERNPMHALRAAQIGCRIGLASLSAGVSDNRLLTATVKCLTAVAESLNDCLTNGFGESGVDAGLEMLEGALAEHRLRLSNSGQWWRLAAAVERVKQAGGNLSADISVKRPADSDLSTGVILRLLDDGSYGFIAPDDGEENVFFHRTELGEDCDVADLAEGVPVSYRCTRDGQGRLRGTELQVLGKRSRNRDLAPIRSVPERTIGRGDSALSIGVLKSYLPTGFGFIAPTDGSEDVFFHRSGLADDCSTDDLVDGATVEYESELDGAGRPRGTRVRLVLDERTANNQIGIGGSVEARFGGRLKGTVIVYFDDRGYGFVRRDDGGDDVYLHVSELAHDTSVAALEPGVCLSFTTVESAGQGLRASEVRVEG
jgi:cold shock CspA family protein/tetratricopeptide (TPR) repeat protein